MIRLFQVLGISLHLSRRQATPRKTLTHRQCCKHFEAGASSDVHPWTIADPFDGLGPDLFQTTGRGLGDIAADHFSHSSVVDISGEALFLTSPGSFPPSDVTDQNLHMSMSTHMQNPDCYQPLRGHQQAESQPFLVTPPDPQPEVFVSFCYLA